MSEPYKVLRRWLDLSGVLARESSEDEPSRPCGTNGPVGAGRTVGFGLACAKIYDPVYPPGQARQAVDPRSSR